MNYFIENMGGNCENGQFLFFR